MKQAESGGDYTIGGAEPFGGAWQADIGTWHWMGFVGLPNQSSPATQDRFAWELYQRVGWSAWQTAPACIRRWG